MEVYTKVWPKNERVKFHHSPWALCIANCETTFLVRQIGKEKGNILLLKGLKQDDRAVRFSVTHTEVLAFFFGAGLVVFSAFLFFSGDFFFFFSFTLCFGLPSSSDSPSLSEEDGSLSNLVQNYLKISLIVATSLIS